MAHIRERTSKSKAQKRGDSAKATHASAEGRTFEIRESFRTEKGPRARVLASFAGTLTNRILDLAEAKASQTWDRDALIAQALSKGIPFASSQADRDARRLLIDLRRNHALDSNLVHLLMDELSQLEAKETPIELEDAVEWLGSDKAERGSALRDLLRLSDQIVRSRSRVLKRRESSYPKLIARDQDAA